MINNHTLFVFILNFNPNFPSNIQVYNRQEIPIFTWFVLSFTHCRFHLDDVVGDAFPLFYDDDLIISSKVITFSRILFSNKLFREMAVQVSSFKFESCILLQFKSQKEVKIVIRCCHSLRQIIEYKNITSYCGYVALYISINFLYCFIIP